MPTREREKPEIDEADLKAAGPLIKGLMHYINVVLIVGTFLVNFGVFKADYAQLGKRMDSIEALKLEEMKWIVSQSAKRLDVVEGEQKNVRDTIYEMKTKIDVIAQWVADQKQQRKEEK